MRSPERSARWAVAALVATGLLFAALATWTLVERSTIPNQIRGSVTSIEVRREKHPGIDDVNLIAIDNARKQHVDANVASRLDVGDRVEKAGWDRRLLINGHEYTLSPSDRTQRMLALAPALAAAIFAIALISERDRRRHNLPFQVEST